MNGKTVAKILVAACVVAFGGATWFAIQYRGDARTAQAQLATDKKLSAAACDAAQDVLLKSTEEQLVSLSTYREPPSSWTRGIGNAWVTRFNTLAATCGEDPSAASDQWGLLPDYLLPRGHVARALRQVRLLESTPRARWSSIAAAAPTHALDAIGINVEKGAGFSSPFHVAAWRDSETGACEATAGCALQNAERARYRTETFAMLDSIVEFWRDVIVERRDLLDAAPTQQQAAITTITNALGSIAITVTPPAGANGVIDMARWAWDAPNQWAQDRAAQVRTMSDDDLRAFHDQLFAKGPDYQAFRDALAAASKTAGSRASK